MSRSFEGAIVLPRPRSILRDVLERVALVDHRSRLERRDAVEDGAAGDARDRHLLRRRAGQDAGELSRPAERERDAVFRAARLEDFEVELDDVPAGEHVRIDGDDGVEEAREERPLVRDEGDFAAIGTAPADEDVLAVGRRDRGREQGAVPAVGLEIEREEREGGVGVARLDAGVVEEQDAPPLRGVASKRERGGDEALHEEAVRGLDVRFEGGVARGSQAVALVEKGALGAEVEGVDRIALEGYEGARGSFAGAGGGAAGDEHDGFLGGEAGADWDFGGTRPEEDFELAIAISPFAREEEGIELAEGRQRRWVECTKHGQPAAAAGRA